MAGRSKYGFTLMEVTMAVFVMAVGILILVGLYPFAFRETEQSREDVAGAAAADAMLNQIAAVLSSTNMTWSKWENIPTRYPGKGWYDYVNKSRNSQNALAKEVFDILMNAGGNNGFSPQFPELSGNLCSGLFFTKEDSPNRISISARVSRLPGMLLTQPIYYTEVSFQGNPDK